MFSGIIRHIPAALSALAVVGAALALPGGMAAADPDQDQKFFQLLGQKDIPPVDGENDLVITAHKVCTKLDGGMAVGDMVEVIRNNGFNENPLTRLQPPDRLTRTIDRFITASVEAYCPGNRGKIASISGYRSAHLRIELAAMTGPAHAGDIAPTKPLPVPAQPAPQVPQEIEPVPQQPPPPPPPRKAPPPPKQQPPPPVEQPPPPVEAPEAPPPEAAPGSGGAAPAPESPGGAGNAPAPGGGTGGGNTPAPPTPDQPSPPGHIRLAP